MDTDRYRLLCARPDVMARKHVQATFFRLRHVRPDIGAALAHVLESSPVTKPPSHSAGSHSDHLWLDLDQEVIIDILFELGDMEASLVESEEPYRQLTDAATLFDLWNRAQSSRASGSLQ